MSPIVAEIYNEGREEGRAEGEARGKAEKMLEMVKNFLSAGASIELIQKATGWSEEQILKAAEQN